MFIDVKKAHLNGRVDDSEYVFVELPIEYGKPGCCARLRRWLYGMRPAASAWEKDYCEKLEGEGFKRGASAPTVFHNFEKGCTCVVHGDDFTILGTENVLKWIEDKLRTWYEIKLRAIIGSGPMDAKEATLLNRIIRRCSDRLEYEADPRQAEKLIQ